MSLEVEGTAIMPTPIPPWMEMGKGLGLQEFFTILGSSKVLEIFLAVIVRIVGVLLHLHNHRLVGTGQSKWHLWEMPCQLLRLAIVGQET